MNIIEEAINNLPYSTDFWKMRCTVAKLIQTIIWSDDSIQYKQFRADLNKNKYVLFLYFEYEGERYLWSDLFFDNICETSQLEHVINQYVSKIIYAPITDASPLGAMFFNMIETGIAKPTFVDFAKGT